MGKKEAAVICDGHIDTERIYNVHREIKKIVDDYKEINKRVADITSEVNENWVGKGHNEFESQYNMLIRKIEDFGDTLQDIYKALVKAETEYEDMDDDIRQDFTMAMKN